MEFKSDKQFLRGIAGQVAILLVDNRQRFEHYSNEFHKRETAFKNATQLDTEKRLALDPKQELVIRHDSPAPKDLKKQLWRSYIWMIIIHDWLRTKDVPIDKHPEPLAKLNWIIESVLTASDLHPVLRGGDECPIGRDYIGKALAEVKADVNKTVKNADGEPENPFNRILQDIAHIFPLCPFLQGQKDARNDITVHLRDLNEYKRLLFKKSHLTKREYKEFERLAPKMAGRDPLTDKELHVIVQTVGSFDVDTIGDFLIRHCNVPQSELNNLSWTDVLKRLRVLLFSLRRIEELKADPASKQKNDGQAEQPTQPSGGKVDLASTKQNASLAKGEEREDVIVPKPPEFLQKLLWMRKHGMKHWKLIVLAVIILLSLTVIKWFLVPYINNCIRPVDNPKMQAPRMPQTPQKSRVKPTQIIKEPVRVSEPKLIGVVNDPNKGLAGDVVNEPNEGGVK